MDDYLVILLVPLVAIGWGVMLIPFMSRRWPSWLLRFAEFSGQMALGSCVGGTAFVLLVSIGVTFSVAVVLALPITFFAGRYFMGVSDRWDHGVLDIKRRAWNDHRRKEDEASKAQERVHGPE